MNVLSFLEKAVSSVLTESYCEMLYLSWTCSRTFIEMIQSLIPALNCYFWWHITKLIFPFALHQII